MDDLKILKLKEEIELLRAQRNATQRGFLFDTIKTTLIFLGGCFVFWTIQNPESALKISETKASLSREKFRMIKEILSEPNDARKIQLLNALKISWSDRESWIDSINFLETELRQEDSLNTIAKITKNPKLASLIDDKRTAIKALEAEYLKEIDGTGGSRLPGIGPRARMKRMLIENVNTEINSILTANDSLSSTQAKH